MTNKELLINKALKEQLLFTSEDAWELSGLISFSEIREMIRRNYDMNEEILREFSDASKGFLGKLNKISTKKRIKKYYKRIKRNKISYKEDGKIILAEGDSWFQFPLLIRDIIDWLNKRPTNGIYSIAYGGDWLTNIIYEADYISELPIHDPDVLLISGGGNDLVGGNRLAVMVDRENQEAKRTKEDLSTIDDLSSEDKSYILEVQSFIRPEFHAFINILKVMYDKMFSGIKLSGKYENMRILIQGYDYPFPRWPQKNPMKFFQYMENRLVGSGKWLKRPLSIKGIPEKEHRSILMAMIFEFNEMFKEIAKKHENVYLIDCRGNAPDDKDWIDELHLRNKKYRQIAAAYQLMIDRSIEGTSLWRNVKESKILRVVDTFSL